jgi:hypothetical protein
MDQSYWLHLIHQVVVIAVVIAVDLTMSYSFVLVREQEKETGRCEIESDSCVHAWMCNSLDCHLHILVSCVTFKTLFVSSTNHCHC